MTVWGADADALDDLARTMNTRADDLERLGGTTATALRTSPWVGDDADLFRSDWAKAHGPVIASAVQVLRDATAKLRSNANDQRAASSPGGLAAGVVVGALFCGASTVGVAWAKDTGHLQLADMVGRTPADQAAWWRGLSDDQQQAMLLTFPGALLGLTGLPTTVLDTARRSYIASHGSDIVVRATGEALSIRGDIGSWEFGAEGGYTIEETADGGAVVTLDLKGDVGRSIGTDEGGASAGVTGGVTATYVFDSVTQAEAFADGLKGQLLHNPGGIPNYLNEYSSERTGLTAAVGVQGEMNVHVGGQDVEIKGALEGSYDFIAHRTTVSVAIDGASTLAGIDGSAGAKLAVSMDNSGHVVSASVSGNVHVSSAVGAEHVLAHFAGGAQGVALGAELNGGASMEFHATVDPNDPQVQHFLAELVRDPGSVSAMQGLMAHADAEVSLHTETSSTASIGGFGVTGSHTNSSEANVVTYLKPVNGPWVTAQVGTGSDGAGSGVGGGGGGGW